MKVGKVESLEIVNLGLIQDEKIEFNKSLILFYGDVQQGKSTILTAVQLALGGKVPDDIITHGKETAGLCLKFDNGSIVRKFKRKADGKITDTMKIIIDNQEIGKTELKKLVNPFQLNQDFFTDKSPEDKMKYFVDMFDVDTSEVDGKISTFLTSNSSLRSEIKGYGDINPTKAEKVDVDALTKEDAEIREANKSLYMVHQSKVSFYDDAETSVKYLKDNKTIIIDKMKVLEDQLAELEEEGRIADNKINEYHIPTKPVEPVYADLSVITEKLSNAKAGNVMYDQYIKDKVRLDKKLAKESELKSDENELKRLRVEKSNMLSSVNLSDKIPGLDFNEEGKITYEGSAMSMISDSQGMRLSSAISALYPECFNVELVDRAESLGSSVFELVGKAKEGNRTILATIVSDNPAKAPEEVGVYLVEKGVLTEQESK